VADGEVEEEVEDVEGAALDTAGAVVEDGVEEVAEG
jgi:hypothetical protein